MTVLLTLLAVYGGSIAFLRLRNSAHLSWGRQMTDFSTFMVPFNIPAYLLSRLPTTARLPLSAFPQLHLLEDNWQTIRDEALNLYGSGHIAAKDDLPGSNFYRDNRWKSFYLKVYDNELPSAWALAPKTRALIEQVPGMNLALFAVLMPGKKLSRHHDPFAFTLRYSLGLSTPNSEGCGLMVNGEPYQWKDGESIIFDETYLHEAYNGLFYIDNVDSSLSGAGNRLSAYVVRYKAYMAGLKYRFPFGYRVGKWSLHLALVLLIVRWAL
jgi:beta-hydroxylase